MTNRRTMLKLLASAPVVGTFFASALLRAAESTQTPPRVRPRDPYTDLGIKTFINGRGTFTLLSGSIMLPEVMEAMQTASRKYANVVDVQTKVGERIATLLKCEAAMVTSGAASAMVLGAAAAITGRNAEKIRMIPNLPDPKPEIIIQRSHRLQYDHALRNTGARLVEVDGKEQLEAAINENTVMMFFYNAAGRHSVSREEFVEIGKRRKIPTFNDAAADVPPVENLFKYIEMGFDLVTFSGGKAIRGPQSAGLLFGRKDLIDAARLNHSPNGDTIGRCMKVNKEEMIGMLVALETYVTKDHAKEWADWVERTRRIAASAETIPTVKGETTVNPGPANHFPGLRLRWDQAQVKITPQAAARALLDGEPSIDCGGGGNSLDIHVAMMEPEDIDIVARRVKEVLQAAV